MADTKKMTKTTKKTTKKTTTKKTKASKKVEPVVESVIEEQPVVEQQTVEETSTEETTNTETSTTPEKRTFKRVVDGISEEETDNTYKGRYKGNKPNVAAKKAFTRIIAEMKKNSRTQRELDGIEWTDEQVDNEFIGDEIKFSIKECTRCSKKKGKPHKTYTYVGVHQFSKEYAEVYLKVKDEPVKYRFDNVVKRFYEKK